MEVIVTSGIPAGDVVDRIITILRRDLMLGADIAIAPDTPLFDGDLDLDSLDALMLMQSLEKEFNFKIPSETFGPEIFKNVNSIAVTIAHYPRDGGKTSLSPDILDSLPIARRFDF